MPIAGDPFNPNYTLANAAVESAFPSPVEGQLPAFTDTMQHYPTFRASMGAKAFRGSNTILGGGFSHRSLFSSRAKGPISSRIGTTATGAARGGYIRQGIRHHNIARPRTWARFGDQGIFHHTGPTWTRAAGSKSAVYNPFYASQFINWIGRKTAPGVEGKGRVAGAAAGRMPGKGHWMWGGGAEGSELMSKGFASRVTAGARLGMMSDRRFANMDQRHLRQFITSSGFANAGAIMNRGSTAAGQALMVGGTGTLSGYMGGFMASTRSPMDREVVRQLRDRYRAGGAGGAGAKAALRGRRQAAYWRRDLGIRGDTTTRGILRQGAQAVGEAPKGAKLKLAGKAAALAGAAFIPVVGPGIAALGYAWLAHDIAKMGVKAGGHLTKGAIESFGGDLRRGVMGTRFQDNEVTSTSRARGVQAIQNSRLNARSVLGNEAGAMAAHFG